MQHRVWAHTLDSGRLGQQPGACFATQSPGLLLLLLGGAMRTQMPTISPGKQMFANM